LRFSELTSAQRIAAVLDAGSFEPAAAAGSLVLGAGRIDGRRVQIIATNPAVARGAIGVAECRGMAERLARARSDNMPVVLLLDSSGARVDEGLPALGTFRTLLREAVLTRLARAPMLAVVGRACFGGASLLALTCGRRQYLSGARLATSGPAVIAGQTGTGGFDARDHATVDALMGSAARVQIDEEGTLVADAPDAVGSAVRDWLRTAPDQYAVWDPRLAQDSLGARLSGSARGPMPDAPPALSARLAAVLPRGYRPEVRADAFCARPLSGSSGAVFLGTLTGAPVGAVTCWQLVDWLLALHRDHPASPIVLLLDADGHAATIADEQVLLSAYLVQLCLTLAWLRAAGHRIVLWIPGRASGASYVTFAAPVDAVSALPSAQIEILPAAAVKQIVKSSRSMAADPAALLAAGVADALLDARLRAYADLPPPASPLGP
jgi:hypothetical protein